MRPAAIGAMLVILTGCGAGTWTKSEATADDFRRDSYECRRDERAAARPQMIGQQMIWVPAGGLFDEHAVYRECLAARGWQRVR